MKCLCQWLEGELSMKVTRGQKLELFREDQLQVTLETE